MDGKPGILVVRNRFANKPGKSQGGMGRYYPKRGGHECDHIRIYFLYRGGQTAEGIGNLIFLSGYQTDQFGLGFEERGSSPISPKWAKN